MAIPAGLEPATRGVEIRSALNDFNDLSRPCCVRVALGPIFRGFHEENMTELFHVALIVAIVFAPFAILLVMGKSQRNISGVGVNGGANDETL